MLAQGMKGNHETKIKKAISPQGGGARVGGTPKFFKWRGWLKAFLKGVKVLIPEFFG